MIKCVLILAENCQLSALPTIEEFRQYEYAQGGMVCLLVETTQEVYEAARKNFKNCFVLSKQLKTVELPPKDALVLECDLSAEPPVLRVK